jgi:hypothetical protein
VYFFRLGIFESRIQWNRKENECSCCPDGAKRRAFLPSTHELTPSILRKNIHTKIRSKHLIFPFFFSSSSLLPPSRTPGFFFFSSSSSPSPHTRLVFFFFFFFFFSLTSPATYHFRPNQLRGPSSFPAKSNRKTPKKTQTQPKKSFLMPQKSILMPQIRF